MPRFNITTTGKGLLPSGHVVGHIEAADAQDAENALIRSGQIGEKWRGQFAFVNTSEIEDENAK